ncbi:MAG: hypothetical protein QOH95_366 [Gaiellaceae bacterium]|jgi:hypothetical protein|nr:hypothetical protein [Gaiellaceae bacterium]
MSSNDTSTQSLKSEIEALGTAWNSLAPLSVKLSLHRAA